MNEIQQAIEAVFQPGDVFEIRVLGARLPGSAWKHTERGYFTYENACEIQNAMANFAGYDGAYYTLNPVNPALLARANGRFVKAKNGEGTSEKDIIRRRWMLIDIDPERPAGIAATEAEQRGAFALADTVSTGLQSMGFTPPVKVSSGNGAQLLFRVDLPADDGGTVKHCLNALKTCSTAAQKIDQSVHNASRICRLPGTWNRKGEDMEDRPHRMAQLIEAPGGKEPASAATVEALARRGRPAQPEPKQRQAASCSTDPGTSPADVFNAAPVMFTAALERNGWTLSHETEGQSYWHRPGKQEGQHSATFNGSCFYVFSSAAAPFAPGTGYSPFGALATMEHNGDHGQAAKALLAQGIGERRKPDSLVDLSGFMQGRIETAPTMEPRQPDPVPPTVPAGAAQPVPLSGMLEGFRGLNKPVVHGLVRRGETMNFISAPKIGKSWLTMHLAVSVACGMDWMGFPTEQGKVLHIDNELFPNLIASRYGKVCEALGASPAVLHGNIDVLSLRGRLTDIKTLATTLAGLGTTYDLVVVDAFYRALPVGSDENDNAAMAGIYNGVDAMAASADAAIVLVHHSSKGSQAGKSVTDVGSGAGSQSRAADTHLVMRRHEEPGVVVMEAEIRSFAPVEPVPLRYVFPLFCPAPDIDPEALHGAEPKTRTAKTPDLKAFVEAYVKPQEPCSRAAVIYLAEQDGLSARRVADLLAVAVEKGVCQATGKGAGARYST